MTEAVVAAPLSSLLEAEYAAVEAIAKFHFDQSPIHVTGAQLDEIATRAPDIVPQDFAGEWRKLMNRINDPDTRDGALTDHPHLKHPESQALYDSIGDSSDWSAYLKFSQSQSIASQASQPNALASSSSNILPAPNQEQQKQNQGKHRQSRPRQMLQIPSLGGSSLTSRTSPSAHERSISPRRSGRAHTTPSKLNGFVIENDASTIIPEGSSALKRKSISVSPADNSEDDELPIKPYKRNRQVNLSSNGNRQTNKSRIRSSPQPRLASTEEAAHIAAASMDPESEFGSAEDSDKDDHQLPPRTQPPTQTGTKRGDAVRSSEVAARPKKTPLIRKAQKTRWTTCPPSSTSEKAPIGTRRSDRSMLAKSDKVPQQNSGDALYEHNMKLSQPAVDNLFGLDMSKGYDNFEYYSTFLEGDIKKEWWVCLKCGDHKKASRPGSSTNLVHHGNGCKGTLQLAKSSCHDSEDTAIEKELQGGAASFQRGRGSKSSVSTNTAYSGLGVVTWLTGGHSVNLQLTRRKAVLLVIQNALAFRLLSTNAFKEFVRSIDVRMTLALKSHQTVRRDIGKIYTLLKREIRKDVHAADSLVTLQHDAWTNKGFQHSFVVIMASWVTKDWDYREVLLSFDVLDDRHTGGTFAGHVIRTLRRYGLDKKWFGPVVSDSTGTNHRMLDLLRHEIVKYDMQQRRGSLDHDDLSLKDNVDATHVNAKGKQPASISSFPCASDRHSGRWKPNDNKILCMNHHINLAVRAGFATFGVAIKAKTQRKVLQIRPAVLVEDEDGIKTTLISGEQTADEEEDDNEEITFEDDEDESEELSENDDEDEQLSDEDHEEADITEQRPDKSELEEDDGGGPGAETSPQTGSKASKRNLKTAIGRLEAFVTAVTRSDLRKKSFRRTIEREYLDDDNPNRVNTPIPPKPNKTRWNSQFAMIEGALKVKEAINQHCRATIGTKDDVFGPFLLDEQHWLQIQALRPLLELAQDITKEMEAAEGTLCLVLDHHASLRDEIEGLREEIPSLDLDEHSSSELEAFLTAMDNKLAHYRELALSNRLTNVAAVLHPMLRLNLFKEAYPGHAVKAEKHLRDLVQEMFGSTSTSVTANKTKTVDSTGSTSDGKKLERRTSRVAASRNKRQQKVAASGGDDRTSEEPDEITKYLDPSNSAWRASDTPYKWWKDNELQFPTLSKVARIVLGIPGSSSSSERVFSQAALYSTNRRARLTASAIGQLVSVNNWLSHGADPLVGLGTEARQTAAAIARIRDPKR